MRKKQWMKCYVVLLLPVMLYHSSFSQSIKPDTSSSPEYKNALAFYNQSLSEELHLFNGREYKGYTDKFSEGTPYFQSDKWSKGTLYYEGKMYENVSLLYDEVKDELVYLYFDNASSVRLGKERVSAFSIMSHNFINILSDSIHASSITPGFYDELYHGNNSLIAKRTKNIQTSLRQSGAEIKVFYKDHYYLRRGDRYEAVSNKKTLLHNLSDKRKELQQYIRQNKLSFRKDMENAMTKTVAYYDQLSNK